MRRAVLFFLFSLAVLASGCTVDRSGEDRNSTVSSVEMPDHDSHVDTNMERVVYGDDGVVCYKYRTRNGYGAGLSCLPLEETDLKTGEGGR